MVDHHTVAAIKLDQHQAATVDHHMVTVVTLKQHRLVIPKPLVVDLHMTTASSLLDQHLTVTAVVMVVHHTVTVVAMVHLTELNQLAHPMVSNQ